MHAHRCDNLRQRARVYCPLLSVRASRPIDHDAQVVDAGADAAAPIVKKALDFYLLGKRPTDKDSAPADKSAPNPAGGEVRSAAELKAYSEAEGGPKAGAETEGNKD